MTLENVLTRKQVFNQRFAGGEAAKAEKILKRIYKNVEDRLLREPTEFQEMRLRALRRDIANILDLQFDDRQRPKSCWLYLLLRWFNKQCCKREWTLK